jgi:hypothetical protein
MLSLERIKEILGDTAKEYTDEKLLEIRDSLYVLAEIALDAYLNEKKSPNKPDAQ